MSIDDYNFAADSRNQPAPSFVLYLDDDEIELPTKWVVCSVCDGNGRHVNPSIDCGGLSAEDFGDDPDFRADYFGGTYDVTCNRCNGRTTERAVDWDALTPEQVEAYEAQLDADRYAEAERLAEIRAGC